MDRLIDTTAAVQRPVSEELDRILGHAFPVLDHGFIRVVDYMGNDQSIEQAARVSYGNGTRAVSETRGLLRYLMSHCHSTPFEMCEIKFHVKLPVFVARQWIRHRTANVNEYSARYSILDREFYIPEPENINRQSVENNQGRGEAYSEMDAESIRKVMRSVCDMTYNVYDDLIREKDGKQGLSREIARMNLPTNVYTQWYWKTDLHNLMNFLRLRCDSHAQYEIREYADLMMGIMRRWVPLSYEAFRDYQMDSMKLSGPEISVLKKVFKDREITATTFDGLSKREAAALKAKMALLNID